MKLKIGKLLVAVILIVAMLSSLALTIFAAQTEDYGKGTITESDVLHVYNALCNGVNKDVPNETIYFDSAKTISKEEMEKGISLFISDHPECFWFRNYYSYTPVGAKVTSVSPVYSFTGSALTTARAQLDSVVSQIMGGLPDGTNYDKALYLHDALASRVEYVEEGEHQTVYGALVAGKAVCAGYAAAYQMLLELAGITAWTVTGESRGIPHAWNALWLDENTCVYTDVTWDDQGEDIYHYYFNLSKEEMALDHTVDADRFTLPSCNHNDKSYFDVNNHTVTDNTSVALVAELFGPAVDGVRSAVLYYTGSDFSQWISSNAANLYRELGGRGSASYSRSMLGNEVHLSFIGTFSSAAYKVTVNTGANMTVYGSTVQNVERGNAINTVIVRANEGYYFPSDYPVGTTNGITVSRMDSKRITISGTPTSSNVTVNLSAVSKVTNEPTPEVRFIAKGYDTGILVGLEAGMKYSTDGINWTTVTQNGEALIKVEPGNIYVVKKGNGESTLDSNIQTIEIRRFTTPTLNVIQPTEKGGNGIIGTSEICSYSTDGESWTACTGALELPEGKYYVCVREDGDALASPPLEITLKYVEPEKDDDPIDTPDGGDTGEEILPPDDVIDGGENNNNSPDDGNIGGDGENNGNTPSGGDSADATDNADGDKPSDTKQTESNNNGEENGSGKIELKSCGMALEGDAAIILIFVVLISLAFCIIRKTYFS